MKVNGNGFQVPWVHLSTQLPTQATPGTYSKELSQELLLFLRQNLVISFESLDLLPYL